MSELASLSRIPIEVLHNVLYHTTSPDYFQSDKSYAIGRLPAIDLFLHSVLDGFILIFQSPYETETHHWPKYRDISRNVKKYFQENHWERIRFEDEYRFKQGLEVAGRESREPLDKFDFSRNYEKKQFTLIKSVPTLQFCGLIRN